MSNFKEGGFQDSGMSMFMQFRNPMPELHNNYVKTRIHKNFYSAKRESIPNVFNE